MRKEGDISSVRLKEILHYDPETGLFTWLMRMGSRAPIGGLAGSLRPGDGYLQIKTDRRFYLSHRLAWFYMTEEWPVRLIDHQNMNRIDNRWSNLREATHSQNHMNSQVYANNRLGLKGVSKMDRGTYYARIHINGKKRYIGSFPTAEEAKAAYDTAAKELFGEFYRP